MAKLTVDELKELLKTKGEFTDEQLAGATKKQLEFIAEGFMRQDDYNREINAKKAELDEQIRQYQEKDARVNAEMAEWANLTSADKARVEKERSELAQSRIDLQQMKNVIDRLAADSGLDATKYLQGVPVPKAEEKPSVDLTGYARMEQVQAAQAQLAEMMLSFTPELMQLSIEHQALYGQPLDARDIVKELRSRATTKGNQKPTDPRAIWEELHKVPEKRAEVEKKRFDDAIAQAEARGREAALSESVIPGQTTTPGRHSIIFGGEKKSALQRPQPGERVAKAAAALRTHKYAPEGQKKPA